MVWAELRGLKMTNAAATRLSRTQFFAPTIPDPLKSGENKLEPTSAAFSGCQSPIYEYCHANWERKILTHSSSDSR